MRHCFRLTKLKRMDWKGNWMHFSVFGMQMDAVMGYTIKMIHENMSGYQNFWCCERTQRKWKRPSKINRRKKKKKIKQSRNIEIRFIYSTHAFIEHKKSTEKSGTNKKQSIQYTPCSLLAFIHSQEIVRSVYLWISYETIATTTISKRSSLLARAWKRLGIVCVCRYSFMIFAVILYAIHTHSLTHAHTLQFSVNRSSALGCERHKHLLYRFNLLISIALISETCDSINTPCQYFLLCFFLSRSNNNNYNNNCAVTKQNRREKENENR